ncbi:MAG: S-methyl-5-thioribose-1-phosphate isomerase [Gemmatimonadaceae bacterium]
MDVIQPIAWTEDGGGLRILDQRLLPLHETYRDLRTVAEVCEAISTLAVRGAPLIGIAGAMGLTLATGEGRVAGELEAVSLAAERIRATRPTAVNLGWALDRMLGCAARAVDGGHDLRSCLVREANEIRAEDVAMCRRIGEYGAELIPDGARVLTHCNAGALATGGIGTALAAIYVAVEQGKRVEVFADETRPLLQGSRLTAWELRRAGIAVTVLVDGAAASLFRADKVDLCIVGADRIAANGDVANKIGTLSVATAAAYFDRPFYVAAPSSTFDPATARGEDIHIEQRAAEEVTESFGFATAPAGVAVYNPAFDVTPAELVSAIISDAGVFRAPYHFSHCAR